MRTMKKGAPISAVTTPTLISPCEGMSRTTMSDASRRAAPASGARDHQPGRVVADERPDQMRRDQADEADGAGHGDTGADRQGDAGDDAKADEGEVEAEARRGLLAEGERAKGAAVIKEEQSARRP